MSERVQKYLARAGYGSRRQIEQWLQAGRIRSANKIMAPGDRISIGEVIFIDDVELTVSEYSVQTRIIAYNKPSGEICSHDDPMNRPLYTRHLPLLENGRWLSVGRLDINTSGLILFSNDGELVHHLMHPKCELEREYLCRVSGTVNTRKLLDLRNGVHSKGEWLRFDCVEPEHGNMTGNNNWFRIVIKRGKNREVRRAWLAVGCQISRLIRVRYGSVLLPQNMKQGNWRELSEEEINQLRKLATINPNLTSTKFAESRKSN